MQSRLPITSLFFRLFNGQRVRGQQLYPISMFKQVCKEDRSGTEKLDADTGAPGDCFHS